MTRSSRDGSSSPNDHGRPAARTGSIDEGETAASRPALRILVADDHRDLAKSLTALLRVLGHEVRTAFNGREAVEAAREFHPEVALLDFAMPEMNGCDVARAIRQETWGRSAVLIALTGWGEDVDRVRSMKAGFDHHLVKPVEPSVLNKLIGLLTAASPKHPAPTEASE